MRRRRTIMITKRMTNRLILLNKDTHSNVIVCIILSTRLNQS